MTKMLIDRSVVEQALEALESLFNWKVDPEREKRCGDAVVALRAALAQQAEPVQDQDVEDAIEAAYWQFDCRKKGLNEWASAPQSERDAFKAEARKLVRGYFPTRQAQDTKREMLAVADAFIRGKRAALAQQAEPVDTDCHTQGICQRSGYGIGQQAEPVEPYCYVYEYDGVFGLHREFYPLPYNGMKPSRTVPVYTAPPKRQPLTKEEMRDLVTNWFAEDWAIEKALGLLRDYDITRGRR